MKPPTAVPRVRDYLRIVARYWVVLVCATALSVGAGWVARETTDPTYLATTRVFVVTPAGAEVSDAYFGDLSATVRATSVQQLAKNPQVVKRTIQQLGLHQTPDELTKRITAVVHGVVVEISVTGDSPELARNTVNSLTTNLLALAGEMADMDKSDTDVVRIDAASGASDHRGSLKVYLILGGVLGLFLGLVLVIALGRARDYVLSDEQVAHIVDETAAGRIP